MSPVQAVTVANTPGNANDSFSRHQHEVTLASVLQSMNGQLQDELEAVRTKAALDACMVEKLEAELQKAHAAAADAEARAHRATLENSSTSGDLIQARAARARLQEDNDALRERFEQLQAEHASKEKAHALEHAQAKALEERLLSGEQQTEMLATKLKEAHAVLEDKLREESEMRRDAEKRLADAQAALETERELSAQKLEGLRQQILQELQNCSLAQAQVVDLEGRLASAAALQTTEPVQGVDTSCETTCVGSDPNQSGVSVSDLAASHPSSTEPEKQQAQLSNVELKRRIAQAVPTPVRLRSPRARESKPQTATKALPAPTAVAKASNLDSRKTLPSHLYQTVPSVPAKTRSCSPLAVRTSLPQQQHMLPRFGAVSRETSPPLTPTGLDGSLKLWGALSSSQSSARPVRPVSPRTRGSACAVAAVTVQAPQSGGSRPSSPIVPARRAVALSSSAAAPLSTSMSWAPAREGEPIPAIAGIISEINATGAEWRAGLSKSSSWQPASSLECHTVPPQQLRDAAMSDCSFTGIPFADGTTSFPGGMTSPAAVAKSRPEPRTAPAFNAQVASTRSSSPRLRRTSDCGFSTKLPAAMIDSAASDLLQIYNAAVDIADCCKLLQPEVSRDGESIPDVPAAQAAKILGVHPVPMLSGSVASQASTSEVVRRLPRPLR